MATNIFLGNPPETIKQFIIENYGSKEDPMLKVPLHFTANEDGSSVLLVYTNDEEYLDSYCEFEYSTDEMKSWNDYPKNGNSDKAKIKLDDCENKTVYFKAKQGNVKENPNLNGFTKGAGMQYHYFKLEGSIKAGGNIQFLLENTGTKMDVPHWCYTWMFSSKSLTQAPLLPATTLGSGCYYSMFSGCTAITQAPKLPATTLGEQCYTNMLSNTSIPEPKYDMSHMTFAEVANAIQNNIIFGESGSYQVQCSDKILIATWNNNNQEWTIT